MKVRLAIKDAGEARRDSVDTRRQETVGASHDGILLMDEARDIAQCCGKDRRDRGIAAKTHHRSGPDPAQQSPGLPRAGTKERDRARERERIAIAQSLAADEMDLA